MYAVYGNGIIEHTHLGLILNSSKELINNIDGVNCLKPKTYACEWMQQTRNNYVQCTCICNTNTRVLFWSTLWIKKKKTKLSFWANIFFYLSSMLLLQNDKLTISIFSPISTNLLVLLPSNNSCDSFYTFHDVPEHVHAWNEVYNLKTKFAVFYLLTNTKAKKSSKPLNLPRLSLMKKKSSLGSSLL